MMAGGSAQGMVTSIRDNKKLLRRKSMFKKERSFLNTNKDSIKVDRGQVNEKKASSKLLKRIREKVLRERKIEKYNTLLILLLFSPLFIFLIYTSFGSNDKDLAYAEYQEKIKFDKNYDKYLFFISDGDKWYEERHWNNAVFQYKKALQLFPNEFNASYRLLQAYNSKCQNKSKDCHKGLEIAERLSKEFPENTELLKLEYSLRNKIRDLR
ncbi:hypothetical protein GWK08_14880 [Leptobacterium flavescens]|uniref:Tetratricopeptide repeat protein n=1 Tax=Leptobacterium flavescens TaxID=472055 RepID=A0A6P0USE5_9FLAO|nr:hypothetical protein [Leptobacterium flavescens]NER14739.1 hypothetical protein [Leptobacterium flavescens]